MYVQLSRLQSLEGLYLLQKVQMSNFNSLLTVDYSLRWKGLKDFNKKQ